jgi:hypothetical protein
MTKGLDEKKKGKGKEGSGLQGVGKAPRPGADQRKTDRLVKSATRRVDKTFRTRGDKKVGAALRRIEENEPGALNRVMQEIRRERPPRKIGSKNIYSGKSRSFSQTCMDDFWSNETTPWTCKSRRCKHPTTTINPNGRGKAAPTIDHVIPWATLKTTIPTKDVCCNGMHWRVVTANKMRAVFEDESNLAAMHQGCNSSKNGPKDTDSISPQKLGICPGDALCTLVRAMADRGSGQLDAVGFDHGVGQQLFAHGAHLCLGCGGVGGCQVKLDHLALTHGINACKPERGKGVAHGLSLRIEHAFFQHHMDAGSHRGPFQLIRVGLGVCVTLEGRTPRRRASSV